jgi:hypothetical protein
MKTKQILTLGTITFLTATAAQIFADDVKVEADVDLPKVETRVDRDRDLSVSTDRSVANLDRTKVRHSQKASGLMGMEVRNPQNEKLGEIKDLVMEDPTKVSYAVLAVGGFLGIGEKLIALPPSALKVASDGEYLILNADKARIQAAPGFAATAWPSPQDPDFNRFWSNIEATGAPAGSERRTGTDVDVDLDKDRKSIQGEVNVDTDRKSKIYTDADKDRKVKIDVDKD